MNRRQFFWRSDYIQGQLEKGGYVNIVSTAAKKDADRIHMYAVNPERVFVDVEFHPDSMDMLRERRIEDTRALWVGVLDSFINITTPYTLFMSVGLLATRDYRGILGGVAAGALYSFFNAKKNWMRIKENVRDLGAYTHYSYWLESMDKADSGPQNPSKPATD